jgi:hypothetical protein
MLADPGERLAALHRVRGAAGGAPAGRSSGGAPLQASCDTVAQPAHREAAGINLPRLPLQVADHARRAPAVDPAERRRHPLDRIELCGWPRVMAIAEVLALPSVERCIAVCISLVGCGQRAFGDDGLEDIAVSASGVVGPAVSDEVDRAVLGDHTMAQRTRKALVSVLADADGVARTGRHRVVDHHATDRTPRALVVSVVGSPAGTLDDPHAFCAQCRDQPVRSKGCCQRRRSISPRARS